MFSGGNRRKLSTAIALVGNPPIVFLVSLLFILEIYTLNIMASTLNLPEIQQDLFDIFGLNTRRKFPFLFWHWRVAGSSMYQIILGYEQMAFRQAKV